MRLVICDVLRVVFQISHELEFVTGVAGCAYKLR